MVGFLVFCLVMGYVIGPMSLMIISESHPECFGSYPQWLMQVFCMAAFYICNLIIFWTGWATIEKVSLVFVLGYVVLFFSTMSRYLQGKKIDLNVKRGAWVLVYMAGMTLISDLSSFGGRNIIPFGWDFLAILGFSMAIYVLARFCVHASEVPDGLFEMMQMHAHQQTS